MNICAYEEHVPAIERKIRVLKEKCRVDISGVLFEKLPKILVIRLLYRQALWLNSFPSPNTGVSQDMELREIVTYRKCDYKKHCSLQYGEYVQVYDKTTNTMERRTTRAIAMFPSGNIQRGHYFF